MKDSLKVTLAVCCIALISHFLAHFAWAEGVSLSTYPSTIQIRAQTPGDIRSGFTIENKSEETVKLVIQLKPFKADITNDGRLIYIENNDPPIFKKVQVVDNGFAVSNIELGPKQSKNLTLRVQLDGQEQPQDQYFSVVFLTVDPPLTDEPVEDAVARSNAQAGIALNVLMSIGPKALPRGYLEEYSTPAFRTSGPVPFTVKIKNNGTHYFTPKGVILIKNIFGQTVGKIDLQNANILAGTSRSLVGTPYQVSANNTAEKSSVSLETPNLSTVEKDNKDLYSVWPEKFLFGFYKAELSIALSENGPLFTQTISFFAIPTNFLIGLSILALIVLLIGLRIRKKLKEI